MRDPKDLIIMHMQNEYLAYNIKQDDPMQGFMKEIIFTRIIGQEDID
jgi:hypothetical protein